MYKFESEIQYNLNSCHHIRLFDKHNCQSHFIFNLLVCQDEARSVNLEIHYYC